MPRFVRDDVGEETLALRRLERLRDEYAAEHVRLTHGIAIVVRAHDEGRHPGVIPPRNFEQIDPTPVLEAHVEQEARPPPGRICEELSCLGDRVRHDHGVRSRKVTFEASRNELVVVDDQNRCRLPHLEQGYPSLLENGITRTGG